MPRIVHMTSAHPRYDTRIFVKQCRTLAAHGHEVSLVVADGRGDEVRDGVRIVDAGAVAPSRRGALAGRLERMLLTTRRVAARALALEPDMVQLHDPELLPAGLRLQHSGVHVVFDAHEDVPTQLLDKPYLPPAAARLLSAAYARYERYACARLDGLLAATPLIRARLEACNPRTLDIANYPLPEEFFPARESDDDDVGHSHRDNAGNAGNADNGNQDEGEPRAQVCYVGSISAIRGIRELVQACDLLRTPTTLALAGGFSEPGLAAEVAALPGWSRVQSLGHLDRAGVAAVMRRSCAGLVTLMPTASYRDALPVKMFEYMAAGIPVIASDFPRWRAIVDASDCGLCVDPRDPAAIAAAIDRLAGDPELARRLGASGRRAVEQRYNWRHEAQKLIRFCDDLCRHPLAHRLAL
jgi:glycosyltransferase involved in cell wall biosynthesis